MAPKVDPNAQPAVQQALTPETVLNMGPAAPAATGGGEHATPAATGGGACDGTGGTGGGANAAAQALRLRSDAELWAMREAVHQQMHQVYYRQQGGDGIHKPWWVEERYDFDGWRYDVCRLCQKGITPEHLESKGHTRKLRTMGLGPAPAASAASTRGPQPAPAPPLPAQPPPGATLASASASATATSASAPGLPPAPPAPPLPAPGSPPVPPAPPPLPPLCPPPPLDNLWAAPGGSDMHLYENVGAPVEHIPQDVWHWLRMQWHLADATAVPVHAGWQEASVEETLAGTWQMFRYKGRDARGLYWRHVKTGLCVLHAECF